MNEVIDLKELYFLQSQLDETISRQHHVSYAMTSNERLLALIVELGELANETRCFKYWSTRRNGEKERISDEYADGMHFFLSLGIPLSVKKMSYEIEGDQLSLVESFLLTYRAVVNLIDNYTEKSYTYAYQCYLNLMPKLDMRVEDVIISYKKKLAVNYTRQMNSY